MQIDPGLWVGTAPQTEVQAGQLEGPPGEFEATLTEQLNMGIPEEAIFALPNAANTTPDFLGSLTSTTEPEVVPSPETDESEAASDDATSSDPVVAEMLLSMIAQPTRPLFVSQPSTMPSHAMATVIAVGPAPSLKLTLPESMRFDGRADLHLAQAKVSAEMQQPVLIGVPDQTAEAASLGIQQARPSLEVPEDTHTLTPKNVAAPVLMDAISQESPVLAPSAKSTPDPAKQTVEQTFVKINGLQKQFNPNAGWDAEMSSALTLVEMSAAVEDQVEMTKIAQRRPLSPPIEYPRPMPVPDGFLTDAAMPEMATGPVESPLEPTAAPLASPETAAATTAPPQSPKNADVTTLRVQQASPVIAKEHSQVAVQPLTATMELDATKPTLPKLDQEPPEAMAAEKPEVKTDNLLGEVRAPGRPTAVESRPLAEPRDIQRQILDQIERIKEWRPPTSLTIKLAPVDLGEITLNIRQVNGESHASIQSTHTQVHQALMQGKQDLMQVIESKGVQLSSFDLNHKGGDAQQQQQQNQQLNREDFVRNQNMMRQGQPAPATEPVSLTRLDNRKTLDYRI